MAKRLSYRFIDTGAMYRMITLHFLRENVDIEDEGAIAGAMQGLRVDFVPGNNDALLNGENVETEIRGGGVSGMVSPVAAVPAVRRWIVPQQRQMGEAGGIVMDGRDIGTVVFPNADLKLFITASMDVRGKTALYARPKTPLCLTTVTLAWTNSLKQVWPKSPNYRALYSYYELV